KTDGIIPKDQILKWSAVRPGANLLALDLARIKRDLELAPWVREAALERILPHTLNIRITEREPLAQVATWHLRSDNNGCEGLTYYIDCTGYVMLAPENTPGVHGRSRVPGALPALFGVPASELRPGRKLQSDSALAALHLLEAFQHSPMLGVAAIE